MVNVSIVDELMVHLSQHRRMSGQNLNVRTTYDVVNDSSKPVPRERRRRRRDGFDMSVQVGPGMYCSPRTNSGPWSLVEVGYPSSIEPLFWPYVEPGSSNDCTNTVYAYVPIELDAAVIELHGGFLDDVCTKTKGEEDAA